MPAQSRRTIERGDCNVEKAYPKIEARYQASNEARSGQEIESDPDGAQISSKLRCWDYCGARKAQQSKRS
jgi:hypothetical protein